MPGVLVALWWSRRDARALAAAVAGVLIPLALAASMEVWWFQRPVAAHLRHAVHLVQSAMHVTDAPNPDVPALQAFTLRERYDTVVEYWLLGYGADWIIAAVAAGLAVALLIRLRWRSSLGLLLWLTVILVFAAADVWEVVTAPKWLAGLHRVSPFLVFALFPLPAGVPRALVRLKPDATDTEASVASGFSRPRLRRSGSAGPSSLGNHGCGPRLLLTAAAYLVVAFAGVDTAGGKGLGPRLLLPLFPLLAVSAIVAIGAYLGSAAAADRWVGRAGLVLAGMAVAIHLFGAIPAYYYRNQDDSRMIRSVVDSRERLIVVDDPFTAQMLLPLYYRRLVLLADSDELRGKLGARLAAERQTSLILVTRARGHAERSRAVPEPPQRAPGTHDDSILGAVIPREDRTRAGAEEHRREPQGVSRLPHHRDLRGRRGAARHRGQVDPRGQRQPARQLRARRRRGSVDLQRPHQRRTATAATPTTSRRASASCCCTGRRSGS